MAYNIIMNDFWRCLADLREERAEFPQPDPNVYDPWILKEEKA